MSGPASAGSAEVAKHFRNGFYFNGKGIKYRRGLLVMLIPPWPAFVHVLLVIPRVFFLDIVYFTYKDTLSERFVRNKLRKFL